MLKNNFNGGLFGPRLRYRADLDKYHFSVAELKNFLVLPYGGLENRPGTTAVRQYSKNTDVRIVPFQFNNEERFILVFQPNKIEIFNVENNKSVATVNTPYKNIWELSFEQKNDIIWICSENFYPRVLKRYSNTNWVFEPYSLASAPYTENDDSDSTVTVSKCTNKKCTIYASNKIFTSKLVNEYIRVYVTRATTAVNKTFTANGTSSKLSVQGAWRLISTGTWVGTVYLERTFDGGDTWEIYRQYSSNANNNIDASGYETEASASYRVRFAGWEAAPEGVLYECRVTLSVDDGQQFYLYKITEFVSGNEVKCTASANYDAVAETADWSIRAWNAEYGYPKTVAFTPGDRLAFAHTYWQPQTIWLSQVGNYNNFYNDTQADSALTWTLETNLYNGINWIIKSKKLLVGMASEIGSLEGQDESKPLTIDNRKYEQQIEISAADIPPIKANDSLLLLRRGKKTLVELTYNYEQDGFVAPDMTLLAPEVLQGKVRQMVYQENPYPLLWFVMEDGTCASFTYNRSENVIAWAKHETKGKYLSVAAIPNDGDSDDVFFAVKRDNGVFIEHLASRSEDIKKMIYTDCSAVINSESGAAELNSVTLARFANMEVTALLDGAPVKLTADKNGLIKFPYAVARAVIGLSYESYIETLPFEMMNGQESTLANKKTAQNIVAKFYKSVGGEFSLDGKNYALAINKNVNDEVGAAVQPKSYTLDMLLRSTYNYETVLYFRQREPLPVTLLAVEIDIQ